MSLMLDVVILLASFAVLAYSADRLVLGASNLATKLGISALTIGITIVALGTSLPEVVVSVHAALQGSPEIALGNAVGSNIANLGLVLGIVMLLVPVTVRSAILLRELPLLFVVMLLTLLLMLDGYLGRFDGMALLLLLALLLFYLFRKSSSSSVESLASEQEALSSIKALMYLLLGLVLLPLSAHFIISSSINIASHFGVSHLVIGLTVVALGTSLPELATSLAGARRREFDLVVGNIVGSNIFNLVAVLSLPALIKPFALDGLVLRRDVPVMFAITIVFYLLSFIASKKRAQRWRGAVLLLIYASYFALLLLA